MNTAPDTGTERATYTWSAGRYPSLAPNLLPAIARLVSACGVDPGNTVLDVGCGTGNAALTARRAGATVTGLDVTRSMLELARDTTQLTDYNDISWVAGDASTLPFPDDAFDVVLSSFGHVFSPAAAEAGREMLRVAQPGGRVAFTAWSPDGLVGALTDVLDDYVGHDDHDPWAHLRWGNPEFVRDHLGDACELTFERRIARFRYVSPEHFWRNFAEEAGPLSPALRALDDPGARSALREDALATLDEWFADNTVRVEYLLARGVVDGTV
ncbi:methyltransferase domain-containing protein [Halobacterium salinarum]|uniref:class I SAM-dependent methyltransferase n=1 Tax=Halobacterium salinarum TaxID=2242 RepID=UPI0025625445|nr:methyltransferase domain-containing protein [Halobacterium salinarum]